MLTEFTSILGGIPDGVNPIINLLVVMVFIWTMGVLFRGINQPPMLKERLAGIIFGSTLLGLIRPDPPSSVV